MHVFLCGGGDGAQTVEANRRLNAVIDHAKPLLYIPLAMEPARYDGCYEWISGELREVDVPRIEMVRSAEELAGKTLSDYCALFIGGGNTFKLLDDLKRSGAFQKIRAYLENGGVAFGGSAGAIIFGEDLESCRLDDRNNVCLTDTVGFDVLNGVSLLCHYTNRTAEKDAASREYLLEISKHRRAAALPEEVTLLVTDDRVEVIGDRPFYCVVNGSMRANSGGSFLKTEFCREES
ncbi:MAG: Type 1 glutamine amidotransferase-like domain-containing protein [Clostridia bacterium]|nr:Type 1 glutamine amidotransferase-like domain-containing protein [Clostridia bacterium]